MKQFKNKFLISSFLIALIGLNIGCTKSFLDVNTDPNRVTGDNITPELIFPQAANAVGVRQASGNLTPIQNWMGYFASAGDYAADKTEITYNINSNWSAPIWQNNYDVLFDLYQVKTKALAKGDSVMAAASMILSAKIFQELTDTYGDLPYTQAFNNEKYLQPAYDKAKDVYASLQSDLDLAIQYLKKPVKSSFTSVDIVNGGNVTKWTKFANTLKLRMLIRQSQVTGFSPAAEITKIIANGGVLKAGETISVNPGYVNEANKQSPFYANFGLSPTGSDASAVVRANAYIVGILKNNSDGRLTQLFLTPSGGGSTVVGNVYGSTGNPIGNQTSKPGPGLAKSATQNQWLLTSFESMFLEAEAIARGWMPGSAQTAYQNAVSESFVWLGVPNAATAANTYYTTASIATWANAGTTVATQTKFIAFQKYIALCGTDPLEAWSDLRRLNMLPAGYISVDPSKVSTTLPVRLLYPQSEFTTNNTNVNAAGGSSINQFTSKLFWQP